MVNIIDLLVYTIEKNASDLHLTVGSPPLIRIDGILIPVYPPDILTKETIADLVFSLLSEEQKEKFLANKELDFSFALEGRGRFRVNIYFQQGFIAASLRLIPLKIKDIEELRMPKICHEFARLKQGFILVVGPTGHGKSSTLAAILNEINLTEKKHIITIEDPIEYIYPKAASLISQREMHLDTLSWSVALRSVLREDPDVVMVGEMRDYETISSALTIAETGHLVFATLHTNSAAQTIDRIVDVFPENQQQQVRMQLSSSLEAIVSQRLVPCISGGRIPATEILLATPAIKNVVREAKTHLIDNIIQTSAEMGMEVLESSLSRLIRQGFISLETAQMYALRPDELMRLFRGRPKK